MTRLFPFAATNAPAVIGGALLPPRTRGLTFSWVSIEQISSPPNGRVQLSIATKGSPAISFEARRFSVSSSFPPSVNGAALKPVAITQAMSTSLPFPVPAVGALNACSGAAGRDRRTHAVRIADKATERSCCATKGNPLMSLSSEARAAKASIARRMFRNRRELNAARVEEQAGRDVVSRRCSGSSRRRASSAR